MKTISKFICSLLIFCNLPLANAESDSALFQALQFLDQRFTATEGIGDAVITLSKPVIDMGFTVAGVGAFLQHQGQLKGMSIFCIKWGSRIIWTGFLGTGLGGIISILEPSPAKAATLAESFKSMQGLARYFKLPIEHQLQIASSDQEFAEFILSLSNTLQKVETAQGL
jgi:hypothetical protein